MMLLSSNNIIEDSGIDGIFVDGGNRVRIGLDAAGVAGANTVTDSEDDAIDVDNNADAMIANNILDDAENHGIEVSGSVNAMVDANTITNTGVGGGNFGNGINLTGSANSRIRDNIIGSFGTFIDGDGIFVSGSDDDPC